MVLFGIAQLAFAAPVSVPSVSVPKIPKGCPAYYVVEAPGLGDQVGYWTEPTTDAILAGLAGGTRYALQYVTFFSSPPASDANHAV